MTKKTIWAKIVEGLEAEKIGSFELRMRLGATDQNLRDIKAGKSKNPCGMLAVRLYKQGELMGMELPQ